ncbi:MAG: ATP-dependent zinc metalloprotease FtsH [bacterium]|nr:ATP-dependent zinc metalloprotease FtsH [bacterium]
MKNLIKQLTFWLAILVVLVISAIFLPTKELERTIDYSEFLTFLQNGQVKEVAIYDNKIAGKLLLPVTTGSVTNYKEVRFNSPILETVGQEVVKALVAYNQTVPPDKQVKFKMQLQPRIWYQIMSWILPVVFFVAIWFFIMRQMQIGSNRALAFGRSRAKVIGEGQPKVTFNDVAGADEAKEELQEIIEFLRDPQKFQKLGGRIPKGVLLVGPPGTGKTLLARAVAGEANVPFFSISGSDFVEMFVGVGASRVRDLFDTGKKHAPCIIFIDEIDAVGRQRGAGLGGGHDEREQTLNALLVEMDGFNTNEGVILIAATNRPDVLDPALLRPGRFDRTVVVDLPDLKGREGILKVHTRKIPLSDDVDLNVVARGTPYFSGADLANLVNEAALLAARRNKKKVEMIDMEEARDKVMMGPERKSRVISEREKKITAYHEAGHALVNRLIPGTDPVHKVTIIPRGLALGLTQALPQEDRHLRNKTEYLNDITVLMGGRVAEEEVFGDITGGASSDIKTATQIAHNMVCEWGMSEKLGPMTFGRREEHIFLGREITRSKDYSEQTAIAIDNEVRSIIDQCYQRAKQLIRENMDKLHTIAEALLERETLDHDDVEKLMRGEPLPPIKNQMQQKSAPQSGSAVESSSSSEPAQATKHDTTPA